MRSSSFSITGPGRTIRAATGVGPTGRHPARDARDPPRTSLDVRPARTPPARRAAAVEVRHGGRDSTIVRLPAGGNRPPLLRGPTGDGGRCDPRLRRIDGEGPSTSWPKSTAGAPRRGRRCRLIDASATNSGATPPRSSPTSSDSLARWRRAFEGEVALGPRLCWSLRRSSSLRSSSVRPIAPAPGPAANRASLPWSVPDRRVREILLALALDRRVISGDRGDLPGDPQRFEPGGFS